jgi:uncharacterized small protein (DUF1192 family)
MAVVREDPLPVLSAASVVEVDDRAARRSLRAQIARLEAEIGAAIASAYPRTGPPEPVAGFAGPRLLDLGELERMRDELDLRLREVRGDAALMAERQAAKRLLIEQMLVDPPSFKWVRVSAEDIGEHGCKHWHVRPRLGPIGMLMGWWRVKISSGCPLAVAAGGRAD